ncbi:unnamed protein product, partial [marine sediment metagenome]
TIQYKLYPIMVVDPLGNLFSQVNKLANICDKNAFNKKHKKTN